MSEPGGGRGTGGAVAAAEGEALGAAFGCALGADVARGFADAAGTAFEGGAEGALGAPVAAGNAWAVPAGTPVPSGAVLVIAAGGSTLALGTALNPDMPPILVASTAAEPGPATMLALGRPAAFDPSPAPAGFTTVRATTSASDAATAATSTAAAHGRRGCASSLRDRGAVVLTLVAGGREESNGTRDGDASSPASNGDVSSPASSGDVSIAAGDESSAVGTASSKVGDESIASAEQSGGCATLGAARTMGCVFCLRGSTSERIFTGPVGMRGPGVTFTSVGGTYASAASISATSTRPPSSGRSTTGSGAGGSGRSSASSRS